MSRSYTKIFKVLAGLNNKVHPMRSVWNPEDPICDVIASQNVLFDDTGAAILRGGLASLDARPWRSGFSCRDGILAVTGSDLHLIDPTDGFASRVLCTGIGDHLDYAKVNDAVYFVSEEKQGRVVDGVFYPWNSMMEYGRDTNRTFSGVIPSRHIGFHLGRIWLSADEFIIFSEPLGFGLFDLANSFMATDAPVTMIRPMSNGGAFVSTTKKIYFLAGSTPSEFELIEKKAAPAIEWSVSHEDVPARDLGLDSDAKVALWVGVDGIYAGFPDGSLINLTSDRVVFPEVPVFGAGAAFDGHFIFCLGS